MPELTAPAVLAPETQRHELVPAVPEHDDAGRWLAHRTRSRAVSPADAPSGRYLLFESDEGSRLLPLGSEVTRIGRSLSADVRIEHASVSRSHALVVFRGGRWFVLDDRSMNGTWLNGRSVAEAELHPHDVIRVGRVVLRFHEHAGRAAAA